MAGKLLITDEKFTRKIQHNSGRKFFMKNSEEQRESDPLVTDARAARSAQSLQPFA
jgi:hypothetical protein